MIAKYSKCTNGRMVMEFQKLLRKRRPRILEHQSPLRALAWCCVTAAARNCFTFKTMRRANIFWSEARLETTAKCITRAHLTFIEEMEDLPESAGTTRGENVNVVGSKSRDIHIFGASVS